VLQRVKYIENNLSKLKVNNKPLFRNKFLPLLSNIKNVTAMRTKEDELILFSLSMTKSFLKDNQQII